MSSSVDLIIHYRLPAQAQKLLHRTTKIPHGQEHAKNYFLVDDNLLASDVMKTYSALDRIKLTYLPIPDSNEDVKFDEDLMEKIDRIPKNQINKMLHLAHELIDSRGIDGVSAIIAELLGLVPQTNRAFIRSDSDYLSGSGHNTRQTEKYGNNDSSNRNNSFRNGNFNRNDRFGQGERNSFNRDGRNSYPQQNQRDRFSNSRDRFAPRQSNDFFTDNDSFGSNNFKSNTSKPKWS